MLESSLAPRVIGQRLVGERFIIIDEPLNAVKRQTMQELRWCGEPVQFLKDIELSQQLDALLEGYLTPETLVVYPGNGAQYPRRQLKSLRGLESCEVPAGRIWVPGSDPICQAGTVLPQEFMPLRVRNIVVIDDVISSGGTMLALHRANAWRFPRARWLAATWVSQRLRARPASGLSGFTSTIASVMVEKPSGLRSAVNSLSTLRHNCDVAQSYASRHLCQEADRTEFLRLVR